MAFPATDRESMIHQISQEIRELHARQAEAYETAIYLGMSPETAKSCEERRRKMLELTERLIEICKGKP